MLHILEKYINYYKNPYFVMSCKLSDENSTDDNSSNNYQIYTISIKKLM